MRLFGWFGIAGVAALLLNAIVRLTPRALGPILENQQMSVVAWIAYAAFPLMFIYMEGYRGFQKAFVPRAVARAFLVDDEGGIARLLAPLYCMGLIFAIKRRLIASWILLVAIVGLVVGVSFMSDPWRAIVDAGVVAGLSWGLACLVIVSVKYHFAGAPPAVDPQRRPS